MNSSRMDQGAAFVLTPTDMAYLVSGRGMTYISLRSSLEREERTRFWGQKRAPMPFPERQRRVSMLLDMQRMKGVKGASAR